MHINVYVSRSTDADLWVTTWHVKIPATPISGTVAGRDIMCAWPSFCVQSGRSIAMVDGAAVLDAGAG